MLAGGGAAQVSGRCFESNEVDVVGLCYWFLSALFPLVATRSH